MSDCTGYIAHQHGDYHCDNCEEFVSDEDGCKGKMMKSYSKLPRLKDGNVRVEPQAWCRFYQVCLDKLTGES